MQKTKKTLQGEADIRQYCVVLQVMQVLLDYDFIKYIFKAFVSQKA